jgi:hypothetical protein
VLGNQPNSSLITVVNYRDTLTLSEIKLGMFFSPVTALHPHHLKPAYPITLYMNEKKKKRPEVCNSVVSLSLLFPLKLETVLFGKETPFHPRYPPSTAAGSRPLLPATASYLGFDLQTFYLHEFRRNLPDFDSCKFSAVDIGD